VRTAKEKARVIYSTITEIRIERIHRRFERLNFNKLVTKICEKNTIPERHVRMVAQWF